MEKNIVLRFHHLMCIPLFEGKGYSDVFSANMLRIKTCLEAKNSNVTLICGFDIVCENCPNKTEKDCLLDFDSSESGCSKENIVDRDHLVSGIIGISEGSCIAYNKALEQARGKIGKEEFESICGKCRWFKAGVCSFEKWKNG